MQRTDPRAGLPRLEDEARWFRPEDRDPDGVEGRAGTPPPVDTRQLRSDHDVEEPVTEGDETRPHHRPSSSHDIASRLRQLIRVRDWRVRNKLIAVVLIPTIAFLVLAGINLFNLVSTARQAADDAAVAEFARNVTALAHDLQEERDLASGFGVLRDEPSGEAYGSQQAVVDDTLSNYNVSEESLYNDASPLLQARLDAVRSNLSSLADLRTAVRDGVITRQAAVDEYSAYISDLLDITEETGSAGNADLTRNVRALDALSRAKELASQVRGTLYAIAQQGSFEFGDYQALTGAIAQQEAAFDRFASDASDEEQGTLSSSVRGQAVLAVSRIEDAAIASGGNDLTGLDASQWLAASTTRIEQLRTVELELLNGVVDDARDLSATAARQAVGTALLTLTILAISLLASLAIARSMARPLRTLRAGALDVAENRLPDAVQRLRTAEDGASITTDIEPIGVTSRDEIGQVARAFDGVHQQAIRLATEQAVLRRNVNTMFVNLARRSQSLVERLLRQIDGLEQREQDPDQLENLFRLDHLATRMRRNDESLLVLAGSETTRRWTEPVPLPEIVLAAVSEIEDFTRVRQDTLSSIQIPGHAVSDLVHLLAELLENATRFSPPGTQVLVTGRAVRGGSEALIEVEDSGIGMSTEALTHANEQLAVPTAGELLVSRRMGLLVISTLAQRHGIRVALAESERGGTVARVWLPSDLVNTGVQGDDVDAAHEEGTARSGQLNGASGTNGSRPTDIGDLDEHAQDGAPIILPIFESVSAWFARRPPSAPPQRRVPAGAQVGDGAAVEVPDASSSMDVGTALPEPVWESSVDEGWAAAEAAATPTVSGLTSAGLPRRVPLAHFVPGSADDSDEDGIPERVPAPTPEAVQPEQVRGLLSSYYRGVERARESVGTTPVQQGSSGTTAARVRSSSRSGEERPSAAEDTGDGARGPAPVADNDSSAKDSPQEGQ